MKAMPDRTHEFNQWKRILSNEFQHLVPKSWSKFETFISDVGSAPSARHVLLRLDIRKPWNYRNCRWVDPRRGKGEHIIGTRFSKLKVVESLIEGRLNFLICRCDCGEHTKVRYNSIIRKYTTSCGCVQKAAVTKHGHKNSPTYRAWQNMHLKCRRKSSKSWRNFGGKGIKVCGRWDEFSNFLADMGEKPSKSKGGFLNRHNKQVGFTPENCFWSDRIDCDINHKVEEPKQ